jgi:hypothetical protein
MAIEHLGQTPACRITRTLAGAGVKDPIVFVDFGGQPRPGPFFTLTVDQWTALQHLARSIKWPAA